MSHNWLLCISKVTEVPMPVMNECMLLYTVLIDG